MTNSLELPSQRPISLEITSQRPMPTSEGAWPIDMATLTLRVLATKSARATLG